MNGLNMKTTDYIYCKTCEMYVDFWKYNYNIKNTEHEDCNWRYVTEKELEQCIKNCYNHKCFD